ncbi:hypothetical protein C5167_030067 [Papaver somniferum]|uniref:uncharacterized protein LOC113329400 n=1 Tax=Papaver somniferum TaxID=3469 RepID=UPI000E702775|nr:uncharacterized protein LOC113329400 [Papaver somniferum]RZC86721.1 hypothetical protein C5167_030067 [Papaver somniferum]
MERTQKKYGDDDDIVIKMEKDEIPPDEHRCSQTGGIGKAWRCKNFRMNHGASAAADDSVFKSRLCEKHYYYYEKYKKRSGNGETRASKRGKKVKEEDETRGIQQITCDDDTADAIVEGGSVKFGDKKKNVERTERSGKLKLLTKPVVETRASKLRMMITEGDRLVDETSNQQITCDDDTADTIIKCGSANIRRKRKNVERTKRSGELESLASAKEGVVGLENLEHYKTKCFELSLELERKKVEETRRTAEPETETEWTPTDATASWEKMFSYLESRLQRKENGNSAMGSVESRISTLESLFLKTESKYSTMAGCVESHISKLQSLVLRMENKNSTMGCLDSRISNLESLIQRCVAPRNPENIESEVLVLLNGVTGNGEKQRDKNKRSKPDAETSSRGRKDSHMYEWKTKEKVLSVYDLGVNKHHDSELEFPKNSAMNISSGCLQLSVGGENVEEWNGRGCSDVRPSQHGSSFQDQLDMSKKLFANLVSDDGGKSLGESEDTDSSFDSKNSLGDLNNILAMKYRRNRSDDKQMKWKSEADMLSSFEEDPLLCMRAVCAIHRQQISEDKISEKGLFYYPDVLRIITLANFLTEENCKGDLKKSLKDLEIFDSKGVVDCKRMARRYSIQLFSVYQNGKDPFFPPCYNC